MFEIHLGIPEMLELWDTLCRSVQGGTATSKQEKLYRQMGKAMKLLSTNPRHTGLNSHDIPQLTARYGIKVWESYLENDTPKAGRIFWVYGPQKGDITIIGVEPHPNDKGSAYKRIRLSAMGKDIPI